MSAEARNLTGSRGPGTPASAAIGRAKLLDQIATGLMWLAAIFLALVLLGVVVLLLVQGLPTVNWDFLTTAGTLSTEGGIGPQIWVTLYMLLLSLLFTVPLGVGAAVYLAEYAKPSPLTSAIRFSNEALASVPSVVFGVFGAVAFFLIPAMRFSILAGALTLTLLNLPLMVRIAEDSFRAVPENYREASLALGGTQWETIRRAIFPTALPGIITAIVLTSGRIIGETAPLILTTGTTISPNAYYSLNPLNTGETLAVHIWVLKVVGVPGLQNAQAAAAGSAAVLLLIVLVINIGTAYFTERLRRRLSGAAGAPRAGGRKKE